jgi:hypothetical protein
MSYAQGVTNLRASTEQKEPTMSEHKYHIGEIVDFTNRHIAMPSGVAPCEIVRLLSTDGDDPQYRVKCPTETFERVVRESQLHKDPVDGSPA